MTCSETRAPGLIWNRLRYVTNPDAGKRISRWNPQAQSITKEIPSSLRSMW